MVDLTAEQQQLAKIVHDYACRFPLTENDDAQLLQGCYDYMEAFKRVMDSASKVQMDCFCLQHPGYFRFAKWMERLAQRIVDGVLEVPKDR
ncbi:arylsulfatase regulator [Erwinia psidii]|uniref:Arylsulfatase regulator n=1 Tax=Erwinia psidii TaxID=69224 RepID=A0A3N6V1G8_9GAMM|nr:arylsulfatase regulator [Erwinia psidii]MCX8958370.1 arylsulfatase regulator [Erwinia psidii]MCX8961117.1 arylsulfatase regulator [Erwinia psidii]MCX8965454.1 arylsulfatase regulator [Erwinia psidii]RQM38915.1 arylsulfatase regulator [Erwinia psidii]